MPKLFEIEVEKLKKKTLYLSAIVEESFQKAISAFQDRDEKLAKMVIDSDYEIDRLEVDLEEECLKVLALYQPVASDLRYIASILKIDNELERIGDLAVNVSKSLLNMSKLDKVQVPKDFEVMAEKSRIMLRKSLDALMHMDGSLAYKVCAADDEVDAIKREIYNRIREQIRTNPDLLESLLNLLSVSRYLERIADHATNIAEDVIYMLEGEIVRHKLEGCKVSPDRHDSEEHEGTEESEYK